MHPIVLVTGATSGIGRATALHLAKHGHRVFAAGRRSGALEALAAESAAAGHPLETVLVDLDDQATVAEARDAVLAATDGYGVDVLINNAGWGDVGPIAYTSDAELRAQFETNVFGTMAVTRAFLPEMLRRRSGRILNVTSVGGRTTLPMMAAYNASKYAMESLSDGLRIELAPLGVQVVIVEPGLITTGFGSHSKAAANRWEGRGTEYDRLLGRTDDLVQWTDRLGAEPLVIARVMERAIRARWPRARYVAPFHGRLVLAAQSVLPTWVMDALKRLGLGLRRDVIQTATTAPAVA